MNPAVINLAYLIAAMLFVACFMQLSHPRTARRGNLTGALAMLIAIVATMGDRLLLDATAAAWLTLAGGLAVGAAIGATLALTVKMTAMPQMVALLNGFGGGASVLVAGAVLHDAVGPSMPAPTLQLTVATVASRSSSYRHP